MRRRSAGALSFGICTSSVGSGTYRCRSRSRRSRFKFPRSCFAKSPTVSPSTPPLAAFARTRRQASSNVDRSATVASSRVGNVVISPETVRGRPMRHPSVGAPSAPDARIPINHRVHVTYRHPPSQVLGSPAPAIRSQTLPPTGCRARFATFSKLRPPATAARPRFPARSAAPRPLPVRQSTQTGIPVGTDFRFANIPEPRKPLNLNAFCAIHKAKARHLRVFPPTGLRTILTRAVNSTRINTLRLNRPLSWPPAVEIRPTVAAVERATQADA